MSNDIVLSRSLDLRLPCNRRSNTLVIHHKNQPMVVVDAVTVSGNGIQLSPEELVTAVIERRNANSSPRHRNSSTSTGGRQQHRVSSVSTALGSIDSIPRTRVIPDGTCFQEDGGVGPHTHAVVHCASSVLETPNSIGGPSPKVTEKSDAVNVNKSACGGTVFDSETLRTPSTFVHPVRPHHLLPSPIPNVGVITPLPMGYNMNARDDVGSSSGYGMGEHFHNPALPAAGYHPPHPPGVPAVGYPAAYPTAGYAVAYTPNPHPPGIPAVYQNHSPAGHLFAPNHCCYNHPQWHYPNINKQKWYGGVAEGRLYPVQQLRQMPEHLRGAVVVYQQPPHPPHHFLLRQPQRALTNPLIAGIRMLWDLGTSIHF